MAAIKPGDQARFLASGWKSYPVVLVHGSDEGLIRELADRLVALAAGPDADPMNVIDLDGETIAQDPARLADELQTFSMFGGPRVVHVRGAAKVPAGALDAAATNPAPGAFLVLEAGDLKTGVGIRALAEKSPNVAALACYADSAQAIQRVIAEVLQASGFDITNDARDLLIQSLGADRALSRSEIEKLALYAQGEQTVDSNMVLAIVADAGRHEASTVIDRAFAGDITPIETEANRLFTAGTNPAALLSQAITHVLLLRRIARGGGEMAARQARLHFSRLPTVLKAASLWSEARLDRALKHLADAVLQSRRSARLAESVTIRALWAISRMARNEAS